MRVGGRDHAFAIEEGNADVVRADACDYQFHHAVSASQTVHASQMNTPTIKMMPMTIPAMLISLHPLPDCAC
jgi:hypothetical protein